MSDEFDALKRDGRKRMLGVAGVILAVVTAVWFFNRAPDRGPTVECGDLDASPVTELPHDVFCTLRGTVQSTLVLTMGRENEAAMDEATRKQGLRYFVKLAGPVVAAMPGGRPDIETYKRDREHLEGFVVEGVGRVFDAAREKGYGGTATALRRRFEVPEGQPLFIFDAAHQPPSE